jgi:hypothetical protein
MPGEPGAPGIGPGPPGGGPPGGGAPGGPIGPGGGPCTRMMTCSELGAIPSGWASPCAIGPSRSPTANSSELRFLQIISVSAVVIPLIRLERSPACNHSVHKADALPADQPVSSERINPARNRRRHFSAASSFSLASSASICASNRGSTTASGRLPPPASQFLIWEAA